MPRMFAILALGLLALSDLLTSGAQAQSTDPAPAATTADASGITLPQITLPKLSLLADNDSVYALPRTQREEDGFNQGGVNLDLTANYMTAHFYRGVNYNRVNANRDAPNLQFDGKLEFNFGKLPHPFIGLFVNVYDSDPISRFQEIRPVLGLEWKVRPFIATIGHNSYIYPEREKFNTSEVWAKLTFDDSIIYRSEQPWLSPYVYGAYDYDFNKGWYIEAGVRHDFIIEDTGLTVTGIADVGYIAGIKREFIFANVKQSGFQHYDIGLVVSYALNHLFEIPRRFGEWSFNGYVYYTQGINRNSIHSDTQLWGGVGVGFKY